MDILFLTSRLPYPPDRGDRLRVFHFIEHLAADHALHLVSFVTGPEEEAHLSALHPYCRTIHTLRRPAWRAALSAAWHAWRAEPLQTLYYRSAAMQRLVEEVQATHRCQGAYVHLFRMAPYAWNLPGVYRVVDLTDVISDEIGRSLAYRRPPARWLYQLEQRRVARYEAWTAHHFEETWLIAEHDRALLQARCPTAQVQVIPNGVDVAMLRPLGRPRRPESLLFVGHMRVFHNIDAARFLVEEVWPRVRAALPDSTVTLVGADPGPEVQALGEQPGVTVTGFVRDLNAALNEAAVFVAPLRFSAGVQNKVLEAMAAGCPVVTTERVRAGLGAEAGRHLLTGESAAEVAEQVVALVRRPALAETLAVAARAFVLERFTWQRACERWRAIERLITG